MISARVLLQSEAAPRRSLKWRVTYRVGVLNACTLVPTVFRWHSVVAGKAIQYSVSITLGMFQEYDVLQFRVLTRFY